MKPKRVDAPDSSWEKEVALITQGRNGDPFSLLGMHLLGTRPQQSIEVRAFLPEAAEAWVVEEKGETIHHMKRIDPLGFFLSRFSRGRIFPYRLKVRTAEGTLSEFQDPYSFGRVLTDYDLHLLSEGSHYQNYEKLGAHITELDGVQGVHIAVWAPNAAYVSVIGDFNRWDNRRHPMRFLGSSGIWEIFVPGLGEGEIYKFFIRSRFHDFETVKAGPYAFSFEQRPKSASIVWDINKYQWKDAEWMAKRPQTNWFEAPIAIYEVHLGSWARKPEEENRFLSYRELARMLVPYVQEMGYTHIELMPVNEHPLDASWGYQPIGYFSPTCRHGSPEDFMYFVDQCHQRGIGVILDWVPAHFPRDGHGLSFFDGTHLYEHQDWRRGEHRDWGTLVFNYGRNEVKNFLISNALFWFEKYHIDGLRVDAVASMIYLDYSRKPGEWIPNEFGGNENLEAIDFLKKFNEVVHQYYPGVLTVAEESTAWPAVSRPVYLGGLGFDLKWNMGWMNDTLEYISKDPVHRKHHQNNLTFGLLYAFTENFVLVLSHDEVVHGKRSMLSKMPGDLWQKMANLRLYYGFMYGHPGKKLLFMGGEFGQWDEWNFDQSLDWHLARFREHIHLQHYVRHINRLYVQEPALHQVDFDHHGFEWIDMHDTENSVISFIRRARDWHDYIVVVCNFTPVPRWSYRVGVPEHRYYREILNSESNLYGGSNLGNGGGLHSEPIPWHGKPCSIEIVIPPLGVLYFKPS
jgi:1,4-alpha-glucan branching enzyme